MFKPVEAKLVPAKHSGVAQVPTLHVIHSTVSPCVPGGADAIARYFAAGKNVSSAHYVIDPAKVLQCVLDHTTAYHCGSNRNTLGYEMCMMPVKDSLREWLEGGAKAEFAHTPSKVRLSHLRPNFQQMLNRTAQAVARNSLAYDIPVRYLTDAQLVAWDKAGRPANLGGITTHAQMSKVFKKSTHWDPGMWPKELFLRRVKYYALKYKKEVAKPPVAFQETVETNNVMSLPQNKNPLATILAGKTSSVRMLQELQGKKNKAAAAAVPGFTLVPIPKDDAHSNGIIYDEGKWNLLGHRYVKQYDGVSKISMTQFLCIAELQHEESGVVIAFISMHDVTHGNDKARVKMRADGRAAVRNEIREYKAKGIPVVLGVDYNDLDTVHPTADVIQKHKIDHIYAWDGRGITLKATSNRSVETSSDHDAWLVRLTITLK